VHQGLTHVQFSACREHLSRDTLGVLVLFVGSRTAQVEVRSGRVEAHTRHHFMHEVRERYVDGQVHACLQQQHRAAEPHTHSSPVNHLNYPGWMTSIVSRGNLASQNSQTGVMSLPKVCPKSAQNYV